MDKDEMVQLLKVAQLSLGANFVINMNNKEKSKLARDGVKALDKVIREIEKKKEVNKI